MNHILIRRLALMGASASFGTVLSLALLCGVVYGEGTVAKVDIPVQAQSKPSVNVQATAETEKEYPISCTKLVIKNLASYDGAFYEDGTGREVMNVAALMVCNQGDSVIPYTHITVETASEQYVFDATMIPSGACVLIPEKNGKKLKDTEIIDYFGWNTVKEEKRTLPVVLRENKKGGLLIENDSKEPLEELTLFYWTYIKEGDFYMGGMAFETRIPYIAPGESVDITPQYYASGYSEVIYME